MLCTGTPEVVIITLLANINKGQVTYVLIVHPRQQWLWGYARASCTRRARAHGLTRMRLLDAPRYHARCRPADRSLGKSIMRASGSAAACRQKMQHMQTVISPLHIAPRLAPPRIREKQNDSARTQVFTDRYGVFSAQSWYFWFGGLLALVRGV